jgi:hypothetical protein
MWATRDCFGFLEWKVLKKNLVPGALWRPGFHSHSSELTKHVYYVPGEIGPEGATNGVPSR